MTDAVERTAHRSLDALVAERVMGFTVAGRATCIYVEGEWSIHPDSKPDGWACYAEVGPVYVEHCCCADGPVQFSASTEEDENESRRRRRVDQNARFAEEYARDVARFGHSRHCLAVVPNYSTDIRVAIDVVDKLMETMFAVALRANHESGWTCEFERSNGQTVASTAATVSEAICNAALRVCKTNPL